jgi:hypothetical protein
MKGLFGAGIYYVVWGKPSVLMEHITFSFTVKEDAKQETSSSLLPASSAFLLAYSSFSSK